MLINVVEPHPMKIVREILFANRYNVCKEAVMMRVRKSLWAIIGAVLLLAGCSGLFAQDIQLLLAPNGGFSPYNNQRTITLRDGTVVPATLNNGVLDMVQRTPDGGAIKIVMYNFDFQPLKDALLSRAINDGVQVKVLLDNSASWTEQIVARFIAEVNQAEKKALREKSPFDYQVKVVTKRSMVHHHRIRTLNDGKQIYGTMHEKFGVFYPEKNGPPMHAFVGSSNLSASSDKVFAENRMFIRNEPVIAQVFVNQFARLWNLYGVKRTVRAEAEVPVPPAGEPPFEIIFNGEHVGSLLEYSYRRIDRRVLELLDEVRPDGSLEVAMFSFTHWEIAQKILEVARKNPGARIRLLFDQSMLQTSEEKIGLIPPYLEEQIREQNLDNVSIRYKFRANAYGWNKETEQIDLDHFRCHLLHHKLMIVNGEKVIFGSFNWSASAEYRNFEDVMIMKADTLYGLEVIRRFLAEYNYLWDRPYLPAGRESYQPYVIDGEYGRKVAERVCAVLGEFEPSKIRYLLDRFGPHTLDKLYDRSKFSASRLAVAFGRLRRARLVETVKEKGRVYYRLTD